MKDPSAPHTLRLGTRGSALALWQARTVERLIAETGGPPTDIVIIRTAGDERAPADSAGLGPASSATAPVKRMFVKEIEEALLDARIDLAVHSAKDLPATLPDGLRIAAALAREDPRDAIVLPAGQDVHGWNDVRTLLAKGIRIGTSSVRRSAALRSMFPSTRFVAIRGNVDTRLRKLDSGDCDALVLAAAGIKRLGLERRISGLIPIEVSVPAPGQGIVAIEIADATGPDVQQPVSQLDDPDASTALVAERAVVQALGGGCQLPLGVLARVEESDLDMVGFVAALDGSRVVRRTVRGNRGSPGVTGEKLAAALLAGGAGEILSAAYKK